LTDRGDPPRGNTVNRADRQGNAGDRHQKSMEGSAWRSTFPATGCSSPISPARYSADLDGKTNTTSCTRKAISPASLTPKSQQTHRRSDMANKPIRRIAIIGTGVIGASWTALFLAKGLQVVATDVAPNAETALRKFVEAAWPALKRLGLTPGASQSNLTFNPVLAQAVAGVDRPGEWARRIVSSRNYTGSSDELPPT
jgi:hypothetical protein